MTTDLQLSDRSGLPPTTPTVALVAAGALILTSAMFPSPDDPSDFAGFVELLAANAAVTRFVLVAVPVGIWALVAGIALVQTRTRNPTAAVWLRLGTGALLIGAAAITVQFGLGGAALQQQLDGVPDASALWAAATYVRSFAMLIFWAGLGAVGAAVLLDSDIAARWLGYVVILLAVGMVAASLTSILAGPTKVLSLATGATAGVTAIWSITLGLSHARRPLATPHAVRSRSSTSPR